MAQGSQFPLRKPPGFHYDFFLLGCVLLRYVVPSSADPAARSITTFIAGLLGVPAPNGLIPQAPIHTTSLLVMGRPSKKTDEEAASRVPSPRPSGDAASQMHRHPRVHDPLPPPDPAAAAHNELPVSVVEQRVSNLAQGALCLVLLTRPFLHVLSLIPRGVLAGLLCVPPLVVVLSAVHDRTA